MTRIDELNRRLGEGLGLVPGTSMPRFKWALSTDCFWYHREHLLANFERRCWADRLGKVWMLVQWQMPTYFDPSSKTSRVLTEADWWQSFNGLVPYPAKGEYKAHPETQLRPELEPTADITQQYIKGLDLQMSTNYEQAVADGHLEMALDRARRDDAFMRQADDLTPAFGNWGSGTRGGNVSFGGS